MNECIKAGLLLACINATYCFAQQETPLFRTPQFAVYADSIVQGKYSSKAISDNELQTNYQSPANVYMSADITFKFGINGRDNEMEHNTDHHFHCVAKDGYCETPLIKFGEQLNNALSKETAYLPPNTKLKIRLDMREVLNAFNANGYYVTISKDTIYKQDFKGVYVAGGALPMVWDFNNLDKHPELELKNNGNGIYETTLTLNAYEEQQQTDNHWKLSKTVSAFPQYHSSYPITNALYNLALEEMINAIEPDSTFRTGKEWAGVWTRDISYSIILSMAYLQPRVAKYSLLRKVDKNGKIIQDTGTGGAWPASSDRIIWAVAAWELYKVTGEREWLQQAYAIIKKTIEADYEVVYDKKTGLVRGESSFLDWREQTYPAWMQPVAIYESENLGTNAVHYEANVILSKMAAMLGKKDEAAFFLRHSDTIKQAMNKYLWMADKNYYGQYLYGSIQKLLSPRAEALGEALAIVFDVADKDKQQQMVANVPVTPFGITCIYPQIPGIPPYHNNAVWPFVETFWAWAGAKAGNEQSVLTSMCNVYRPAAMFLTNKENFVAETGDYLGTQINSSNMLWSLSGNLSMVYKVLFGIHFNEEGLAFQPFVPKAFGGKRSLANFKYRNAVFDIEMNGYGNLIQSFIIDGNKAAKAVIPASIKGRHTIKITLANNTLPAGKTNMVPVYFSLPAPVVEYKKPYLSWRTVADAVKYEVVKNGNLLQSTADTSLPISDAAFCEYTVMAIDKNGVASFASEPVVVADSVLIKVYEAESFAHKTTYGYQGFSGSGFTEVSTTINPQINIPVEVEENGNYIIDVRYANGNGPINTENKCAIRTLLVDEMKKGVLVMPQRGTNEWSNWGFSNAVQTHLTKGRHNVSIAYLPANENMNIAINQAMIDYVRLIKQ